MGILRHSGRAGWRHRLYLIGLLLLLFPGRSQGGDARHPLEPPDLSSPREALRTFLDAMNRAWDLYAAGDPGLPETIDTALLCLDTSHVAPSIRKPYGVKAAIALKEILDRLELPPLAEIPGPDEVEQKQLDRWVVPPTEIRLVRVTDGPRRGDFIVPADTVERLNEFYLRVKHLPYQPGKSGAHAEELRFGTRLRALGRVVAALPPWARAEVARLQVWQWMMLALAVALGVVLSLLSVVVGRRWSGRPHGLLRGIGPFVPPLGLLLTTMVLRFILDKFFLLALRPALAVRLALNVIALALLAWLLALLLGRLGGLVARTTFGAARPLTQQLVRVLFRVATILIVVGIAAVTAQTLGFPVTALVAGLGVGGLAIALAAQGTLENLIGGIILYADQPVRIGDFCRFGTEMGTVEEIGLRSVKIRTLERTIVNVPNAQFARMQLETLSARDRILLRTTLRLRYETSRQQLDTVLERLGLMLRSHPRVAGDPLRVRFTGLGEYALEVEIYAYCLTTDWADFLGLRQEILLRAMQIIEEAGARLAVPTAVHYVAREGDAPPPAGRPEWGDRPGRPARS